MKKLLTLTAAFLMVMSAAAAETGESCAQAVTLQYGADFVFDDVFWIRQQVSQLDENGISAFWYSTDSLFIEGYFGTGGSWGTEIECSPIGFSLSAAPNAKILIDKGELMAKVETQLAKHDELTQDEKELILSSKIYLELRPRSKQSGRFILNEFGVAAGSDCYNPWIIDLGAVYGLTEEPNVLRLDPVELDTLHVSYEPMRATDKNFTLMNVNVQFGSCEGPVVQSGRSVAGVGEGLFVPRKSLLDSAVALNKPLFFVITRGNDPATVSFRKVRNDTVRSSRTICVGEKITLGDQQVSEAGVYEYTSRQTADDYALYRNHIVTVSVDETCKADDDALDNVFDANVVVRPTGVRVGEMIQIVADGANRYDVYDITGRRVQSADFVNEASLAIYASGEYFVRITGAVSQTRKVVVY